ncbi:acyl-CoA thioesterase [Candidatus Bathyarchaeota archaeon]|nr:MAG: acyl-CoA thioesterase [Candidatus Bathyarchaeota archaeon]
MPSFKTSFRVSWVDTDSAKIVHFSNYFRYFEKAEEEFYRKLGCNFDDMAEKYGIILPRVEAYCHYVSPLKFNDLVEIELSVKELREKAVKYWFKVYNKQNGRLAAEGYIVVVAADRNLGGAVKIPKEIAEKLKSYMEF